MRRFGVNIVGSLSICLFATLICDAHAHAQVEHYNMRTPLGGRAAGLGGAYVAVSDDPSGVIFNPGGLAFFRGSSQSTSVTAYGGRETRYSKLLFGQDMKSIATPSGWLVGGVASPKFFPSGWIVGAALFNPFDESEDHQSGITGNVSAANGKSSATTYQTESKSNLSMLMGNLTFALRVSDAFGVGLGLNVGKASASGLAINSMTVGPFEKGGVKEQYFKALMTSASKLEAKTVGSIVGIRKVIWAGLDWGIAFKKDFIVEQGATTGNKSQMVGVDSSGKIGRSSDGSIDDPIITETETKSRRPMGNSLPLEVRSGFSWACSQSYEWALPRLWTFDLVFHGPTKAGDVFGAQNLEQTLNVATGMEFVAVPFVPVRLGFFTNKDAFGDVTLGGGSAQHVDLYGASVFSGYESPTWKATAGVLGQYGVGKIRAGDGEVMSISNAKVLAWSGVVAVSSGL